MQRENRGGQGDDPVTVKLTVETELFCTDRGRCWVSRPGRSLLKGDKEVGRTEGVGCVVR